MCLCPYAGSRRKTCSLTALYRTGPCKFLWMYVLFATVWKCGRILFILDVVFSPGKIDSTSEYRSPSDGPRNGEGRIFRKLLSQFWLCFSNLWKTSPLNYSACDLSLEKIGILETKMKNIDFPKPRLSVRRMTFFFLVFSNKKCSTEQKMDFVPEVM
jgi:hypothetical protein